MNVGIHQKIDLATYPLVENCVIYDGNFSPIERPEDLRNLPAGLLAIVVYTGIHPFYLYAWEIEGEVATEYFITTVGDSFLVV